MIYIDERELVDLGISVAFIVGMYIIYRIAKYFCKKNQK